MVPPINRNRISFFYDGLYRPIGSSSTPPKETTFIEPVGNGVLTTDLDFGKIVWLVKKDNSGRTVISFHPNTHLSELSLNAELNPWPAGFKGFVKKGNNFVINSRGNLIPIIGRENNTIIDYFGSLKRWLTEVHFVTESKELVYDFENVYDIDPRGIEVLLLSMLKRENGSNRKISLINANPRIKNKLKFVGLHHIFMPDEAKSTT